VGAGGVGRMPLNNGGIVGPTIITVIILSTAIMATSTPPIITTAIMAALAPTATTTIEITAALAPATTIESVTPVEMVMHPQVILTNLH